MFATIVLCKYLSCDNIELYSIQIDLLLCVKPSRCLHEAFTQWARRGASAEGSRRLHERFMKTSRALKPSAIPTEASWSLLEGFAKVPRAPSFGNDSSDNDKPPAHSPLLTPPHEYTAGCRATTAEEWGAFLPRATRGDMIIKKLARPCTRASLIAPSAFKGRRKRKKNC